MKILITNDDGIYASGIFEIAKVLSKDHHVTVIAPDRQKSACAHAITMDKPLVLHEVSLNGLNECDCYALNGTPADCVKIGLESGIFEKPDIVISGINQGANLGTDVFYSGTVGGALEGCMHDVRSFALSVTSHHPRYLDQAAILFKKLIFLDYSSIPKSTAININIPDIPTDEIKGIKTVRQGQAIYAQPIVKREHPSGYDYFWLGGTLQHEQQEGVDIGTVFEGYIVIMPMKCDVTDYDQIKAIREIAKKVLL